MTILEYLQGKGFKLKRQGKGYCMRCPIPTHDDKDPSFRVYLDDDGRQSWYCFGACGTGGDIYDLVHQIDGLTFVEAVALIGEPVGRVSPPVPTALLTDIRLPREQRLVYDLGAVRADLMAGRITYEAADGLYRDIIGRKLLWEN